MLDAITEDDIGAIIAKLLEMAKGGNMAAIREVLDRSLGKPLSAVAVGLMVAREEAKSHFEATPEERRAALMEIVRRAIERSEAESGDEDQAD